MLSDRYLAIIKQVINRKWGLLLPAKVILMNTKSFTITDLALFSGVKPHTIRIWERRYALLQPIRSPGNFRFYTLEDLKKILNIALLKKNGYRVSSLSNIAARDIEVKAGLLSGDQNKWQKAINDLTVNMYNGEPEAFESVLDELLLTWPIEILIEKIIFPFLNLTSLLWIGNRLYEEHLVVIATRRKLILAIESENFIAKGDKTVLLFLPDTKQLDLGLLYSNYFLKRRGVKVLYMGSDVTIQNLKNIFQLHPPTYIFTYLRQNHHFPTDQLLEYMNLYLPAAKLIIGEYANRYAAPLFRDNLIRVKYAEALEFLHESGK